jgi:hypothetical protein
MTSWITKSINHPNRQAMQGKEEIKEWYNKNDILNIYPMGASTYKRRIKKLNTPLYSGLTRMTNKKLEDSNLKFIQVREIHSSALNTLFGDLRSPSSKDIRNVIKWVNSSTWNWFGDIVPCKTYPLELEGKMKFFFNKLKKIQINKDPVLFYSIEQNTKDNYFHAHFLINDEKCILTSDLINEQLELVCEKNTPAEKRIFLEPYDYKTHGSNGSNYTLKDLQFGYEILK